MPPFCWRLITYVAILWAACDVIFYRSYSMALAVAGGYCLARGIKSWEQVQAQKAAAEDQRDVREE